MSDREASTDYSRTMFPLAWTIARAYRQGKLAEAREWMAATGLHGTAQSLVDMAESQLDEDSQLIDYSNWILADLPQGEAYMIDADRDTFWALILLMATQTRTKDKELSIRVGQNAYDRRDQIMRVIGEIEERAPHIATDFAIENLSEGVLPQIRTAFAEAFSRRRQDDVRSLLKASVDERLVSQIQDAALKTWAESKHRRLFEEVGSVQRTGEVQGPPWFGITARVPKLFLIAGTAASDNSAEMIGESLGRSIFTGEAAQILGRLSATPASPSQLDVAANLRTAAKDMDQRGNAVTHYLIPSRWRLVRSLTELGISSDQQGELSIGGVPVIEWDEIDSANAFLLHLPQAVRIDQSRVSLDARADIDIHVSPIEGSISESDDEPYVRVWAREAWRFYVARRYVRRIPLTGVVRPSAIGSD